MPNLKEVKNRIVSVTSTQQITKAMKMVAAAKLRRAQEAITQMRPYAQKLNEILQNVSTAQVETPFAEQRDVQRVLLIAVTSDRGLSGAFNANIFRRIKLLLDNELRSYQAQGTLEVMPIGKKGLEYYKRRDVKSNTAFSGLWPNLSFDEARRTAEFAMNGFLEKRYDKVLVVYNEFKNVATQIVQVEQLLPLLPAEPTANTTAANIDYIFEPTKEEIVTELIPKSIKVQFYKMLLDSRASEEGARMTAMDKATDNAGELLKELKLTYNRTRQAAITKEILEIVGGAEALSNG
jgi:F-type H+-transporting ATPase subunit gamma